MDTKFYLADEFRQEVGGKTTAIGMYPHHKIITQVNHQEKKAFEDKFYEGNVIPYSIERVSFLFSVETNPGTYDFNAFLTPPNSQTPIELQVGKKITVEPNKTCNIFLHLSPFSFNEGGDFTVKIILGEESSTFVFNIAVVEDPIANK